MKLYAWAAALAGWGLLLPLLAGAPLPPPALLAVFVLLAVAAKWLMVPLPRGGYGSAGLAVASAALVIVGSVYAALIMSIGVVIGNGLLHRRPFLATVFNSGQNILAVLAAGVVFSMVSLGAPVLPGPLYPGYNDPLFFGAFLAAVIACIVTSSLLTSGMVARTRGVSLLSVFGASIAWEAANDLAFAGLGLVLALIYLQALPVEAIVLTVPLLLVGYVLMLHTTREQAHRELEIIERIGRASITLDLEHLYRTMYDSVRQLMPAEVFYVALYDAEHDALTYEFLVDSGRRFPPQTRAVTAELRAILSGRTPQLIQLTPRELNTPDPLPRIGHAAQRSASMLYVPVLRGEQVIGLLSVQSYVLNSYTPRDARLMDTVAAQVAAAIDNARLLQARARSVEQLTSLQRIANAIAGSLKMDDVVAAIMEGARQMLAVDRCAIYLGTEKEGLQEIYAHGLPPEYVEVVKRSAGAPMANLPIDFRALVVVEDVEHDVRLAALREMVLKQDAATLTVVWQTIKTMVSLPLLYQSEMLGVLVFYHTHPRPYSEQDKRLAQAIADQAAIAVKNTTLLTQAQHRAAEVNLMNRVLSTVTGTLDVDGMFRRIVEEVSHTFGYTHVSIHRVEGDYLVPQAQVGYRDLHDRIHLTKGILGRVARTGTAALLPDVTQDRDYIVADPKVRSEAVVPITADNRVLGVLNVEADNSRRLGESDLALLQSLAGQLGVALRNATLFEEAQRSRDEITVLYEAAKTISSSLELETVLNNLVQVTCQAFGYEQGAILLVDDRSGDLVVEATYGYAPGTHGYRIPAGKGITGAVQRTGQPETVADVRRDARYIGITQRIVSEIAVPLISEGRVIGVFNLESTRRAAFGPRDLRILTALAGYATIAIENARLYEKTKRLAITDGLTELFNHRYLHETLERTLERCRRDERPLAVIMLEIDSFKRYNDTYGHQRGDDVLRTVADLLRKGSRASDIVARYGGDEFMIVLPYTSKETAAEIAERLRRAVEAYPFLLGENIVSSVTLSVGVAANPDDSDTVDALVDAVDRAQYTAKRSGGNKVCVAHSVKEKATG
jgi:diguanylate cyclase (GGDEF)-like protein